MYKIAILLGSVREGRQSQKAAYYINNELDKYENVEVKFVDLFQLNIPMFSKQLKPGDEPEGKLKEYSDILRESDSIIIVTPEYKGGYPAVLKNALDHVRDEMFFKPVAVASISSGGFGGSSVLTQLRVVLLHMGALPIPARLPVSYVQDVFGEEGQLLNESYKDSTDTFIKRLLWFTEAIAEKKKQDNNN